MIETPLEIVDYGEVANVIDAHGDIVLEEVRTPVARFFMNAVNSGAALRAENERLRLELTGMADGMSLVAEALNSTRLIMRDKETRDYAGEMVTNARKQVRDARAALGESNG